MFCGSWLRNKEQTKLPGAGNDAAQPDRENAAFRGRRAQLRTGEVVALDKSNLSLATDTPIKAREQDLIGRTPFAERLADILKSAAGPESLVIGLYGPWGSGKTSVINLVENALSRKDDDGKAGVSVVRFEPWNYLTSEQLLAQFLKEVGSALDKDVHGRRTLFGKLFGKLCGKRPEVLNAFAAYSEALLITAGAAASLAGAPLAGVAVPAFGKRLASRLRKSAERAGSVSSKKQRLEEELLKFDGRVVVIIDDIDRLPNDQVRMVFQLVASLAKLPKINYLLSFDEEVVTRALSEVQNCDGAEYLEKVVQVPVHLPSISSGDLERVLLKDINAIFKSFAYRLEDLDDKRWNGVRLTFLNNRFFTIREVRRFTNALKAKLSILPRFCCFEDVVALAVLELKVPKLVDWIRVHKDLLCGTIGSSLYMNNMDPKDNLANLEELISRIVPRSEAKWAVEAVCRLFPRVANKTGMSHCVSYSRESLNAIWRADSFDQYFHSNMPDGIDVHEVQDALNVSDGGVLLDDLRRHAEAGSMIDFVSAMRARVSTLEEGRAEIVTKAYLLALGLSKEKRYAPLASTSADLELLRLIELLFKQLGPAKSDEILRASVDESKGRIVYPLVPFLISQLNSLNDGGNGGCKTLLPEGDIFELSDAVCARVGEDAAARNLFLDDECHYALILLKERKPNEFMAYAKRIANADGAGCASFLSFGPKRYTLLGSDEVTSFSFDKTAVAKVVELAKVDGLLAEARTDGSFFELPEDCQLVAAAFCASNRDDDDRNEVSAEEAGKLLAHWRRNSRRA